MTSSISEALRGITLLLVLASTERATAKAEHHSFGHVSDSKHAHQMATCFHKPRLSINSASPCELANVFTLSTLGDTNDSTLSTGSTCYVNIL